MLRSEVHRKEGANKCTACLHSIKQVEQPRRLVAEPLRPMCFHAATRRLSYESGWPTFAVLRANGHSGLSIYLSVVHADGGRNTS